MVMAIDRQQDSAKECTATAVASATGVVAPGFRCCVGNEKRLTGRLVRRWAGRKEEVRVWEEGNIRATPVEVCSANHSGCDELVPEVFGVSESNKGRRWRWPSRIA